MSLFKKIILSFILIIGIFMCVVLYSANSLMRTRHQYDHLFDYVMARSIHLIDFHQRFTDLRREVRGTLLNPYWLDSATENDFMQMQYYIANSSYELFYIGNLYLALLEGDYFVDEVMRDASTSKMLDIIYYVRYIYDNYRIPFNGITFSEDYLLLTRRADELINGLRTLDEEFIFAMRHDLQRRHMTTLTLNVMALALAVAFATIMAWRVSSSFRERDEYEANERIRLMLDRAPIACCLININLDIIECNKEALDLFQIADKEKAVETFKTIFFMHKGDEMVNLINKALVDGVFRFEWELVSMPCEITFVRFTHNDEIVVAAYIFDLTAIYSMMEEKKQIAAVVENTKAKSRFLARMSHEIRTPISAVLGIAEIQLQNPTIPLTIEEAFAKIYNSSQVLLAIINDILDLSKIEAGKMNILSEKYEAASLINDITQLNVFRIGSRKISFNVNIDENIPVMLIGDELRIKQIMNNLLSNAFKYTEAGKVSLTVKGQRDGNDLWLTFIVSDTGCGMSKEQLNSLYHEYVRFNEHEHRYIEGAGLGMAIVYSLVELMCASIEAESTEGKGTTFTVKIPQKIVSDEVIGAQLARNLQSFQLSGQAIAKRLKFIPEPMPYGKVLIVDDVDSNLFVAKGLLSFYDLAIETCESGYEALALVENGRVYDIIFMDQMMPGIDGMEATRRIREKGYTNPIVALTANALIGQAEVFLQNGFDGFISKPIDTSRLNTILNKFIRDKQPQSIIEAARQNSARFNPEKTNKIEMWEYFSDPEGIRHTQSEFAKSLRSEFSRSQKDIVVNIKQALDSSDMATGRRFAHNFKGLARTIGEGGLADAASIIEDLLAKEDAGEYLQQHLNELEKLMAEFLENMPVSENNSNNRVKEILANVEKALHQDSTESLDIAEELAEIPQAAVLLKQLENFEFEAALKTLSTLKEILL